MLRLKAAQDGRHYNQDRRNRQGKLIIPSLETTATTDMPKLRHLMALLLSLFMLALLVGCGSGPRFSSCPETQPGPIADLPPAAEDNVHLAAVGDILLDRDVGERIKQNGVHSILPVVVPQLRQADIAFANLECPIATVGPRDPWLRCIFRADPATVPVLTDGSLDVLSVANNHTLNSGPEALCETLGYLEEAGIRYVGAACDPEHGSDPLFISVRGLRIGFLAYTDLDFKHGSYSKVDKGLTQLRAQIAAACSACDLLVVSYHWGQMYRRHPTSRQVEVAHASVEAGADLVLGHHPHVLEGIEVYQGCPILYSMGNFVFDSGRTDTRQSAIFDLVHQQGAGWRIWITPVWINGERLGPEYTTGAQCGEVLGQLSNLSEALGTRIEIIGGRGYVDSSITGAQRQLTAECGYAKQRPFQ